MNTNNIDKVLGQRVDSPTTYTPDILVREERQRNRTYLNIQNDDLPFVGYDSWNAYEFSTLLTNGFPVSGWLKFTYDSDTPNIVESKSVKLYLNSYNMARLINSLDDIWTVEDQISKDLSNFFRSSLF